MHERGIAVCLIKELDFKKATFRYFNTHFGNRSLKEMLLLVVDYLLTHFFPVHPVSNP